MASRATFAFNSALYRFLSPVTSEEELYEITFNLLGCSLEDLFFPLVLKDSPYKSKVVVLVDRQYVVADPTYEKIEKALVVPSKQLFKLTATTLEDYLHEDLFAKSGLDKTDTIKEIEKEKEYEKKFQLKIKNARTIAAAITEDDLKYIPEMVDAVERASTISLPRQLTAAQSSS